MAISTRMSRNPVTPSAQSPSIGGAPLELEAKFGEELNGGVDVFYDDPDVVHTLDRHGASSASNGLRVSRVALMRDRSTYAEWAAGYVGCTRELDGR